MVSSRISTGGRPRRSTSGAPRGSSRSTRHRLAIQRGRYTREEDLLSEILGRECRPNTLPRLVRVDFVLHANLPWGSTASVPPPEVLDPWLAALEERLETHLPSGGVRSREGYGKGGREPVDFEVRPGPGGELSLRRIRVNAFWLLTVPRLWDDPKREARERGIDPELDTLCQRFRAACDLWGEAIAALAAFLDYTPPGSPPPDAPVADPESIN